MMAMARKTVAIARGSHAGSIRPNNAWKPRAMPIAARPVRSQLAKVRSLARIVRSSAKVGAESRGLGGWMWLGIGHCGSPTGATDQCTSRLWVSDLVARLNLGSGSMEPRRRAAA